MSLGASAVVQCVEDTAGGVEHDRPGSLQVEGRDQPRAPRRRGRARPGAVQVALAAPGARGRDGVEVGNSLVCLVALRVKGPDVPRGHTLQHHVHGCIVERAVGFSHFPTTVGRCAARLFASPLGVRGRQDSAQLSRAGPPSLLVGDPVRRHLQCAEYNHPASLLSVRRCTFLSDSYAALWTL